MSTVVPYSPSFVLIAEAVVSVRPNAIGLYDVRASSGLQDRHARRVAASFRPVSLSTVAVFSLVTTSLFRPRRTDVSDRSFSVSLSISRHVNPLAGLWPSSVWTCARYDRRNRRNCLAKFTMSISISCCMTRTLCRYTIYASLVLAAVRHIRLLILSLRASSWLCYHQSCWCWPIGSWQRCSTVFQRSRMCRYSRSSETHIALVLPRWTSESSDVKVRLERASSLSL